MKFTSFLLLYLIVCIEVNARQLGKLNLFSTTDSLPKITFCKSLNYDMGLNCGLFVKQYFSFNNISSLIDPYMFTGRIQYKNHFLRAGFGMISTSERGESSSTNSAIVNSMSPAAVKTEESSFDVRVGYCFQRKLSNKMYYYFGVDYLMLNKHSASESSQDIPTNNIGFGGQNINITTRITSKSNATTKAMGVAPIFGVQFFISDRVSIFTEASIRFTEGKKSDENTTNNFINVPSTIIGPSGQIFTTSTIVPNEQKISSSSKLSDIKFIVPNTIYLNIKL